MRSLQPLALLLLCTIAPATAAPQPAITVFAAASLTDVLPKLAAAWAKTAGGGTVTFSFDASSRLAPQIEQGADADVFCSADEGWMDYLAERDLLDPGSRRDLAGNTLVCVVPKGAKFKPSSASGLNRNALQHLALAGENVPAGKYAQSALSNLNVWEAVKDRVVRGTNVRTTLEYVASGNAEAGIVYKTDALAEPKVVIAFTFAESTHAPIRYPGAVIKTTGELDASRSFLAFCASPTGQWILSDEGFQGLYPTAHPTPVRRVLPETAAHH